MRSHSARVFDCTLVLDLSGIFVCIGVLNVMVASFEMRCHERAREAWLAFCVGLSVVNLTLMRVLMQYGYTSTRTALGSVYALVPLLVKAHRLLLLDGVRSWSHVDTTTVFGLAVSYAVIFVGLVVRTVKWPERAYPRRFDHCGASHQLFHVIGALSPLPVMFAYWRAFADGALHVSTCDDERLRSAGRSSVVERRAPLAAALDVRAEPL
eukprot:CAMPEP_0198331962 /NCGR_PEP_ID=MMETSP1450-20131203/17949_1 /TAXON_ID=753684 ORGANISM="Madagascaria erythrocladiodes, Strain CCMP3234" /NCGR_SAMPLE_ID=MMETSP1450 /ASSEMBLY_ACC=CAM_ASM_001115 /LENGTH=209 /DNA_ID=CAMNT_0044036383 /DNA_START=23 /DNA_END=649 /DNA_ORIENTATION=-